MAKYEDYGLQGKAAIVTGGGTGIGESCADEQCRHTFNASESLWTHRQHLLRSRAVGDLQYAPRTRRQRALR